MFKENVFNWGVFEFFVFFFPFLYFVVAFFVAGIVFLICKKINLEKKHLSSEEHFNKFNASEKINKNSNGSSTLIALLHASLQVLLIFNWRWREMYIEIWNLRSEPFLRICNLLFVFSIGSYLRPSGELPLSSRVVVCLRNFFEVGAAVVLGVASWSLVLSTGPFEVFFFFFFEQKFQK